MSDALKRTCFFTVLPGLTLIGIMAVTAGCQSEQNEQPELEIKTAVIHEVQVSIAESFPEQIFVYIKGGLADSCTTFHELTTERIDNTIKITVTTQRPVDVECAQVYGYFEQNVALGSDFVSGKTYLIDVNGVIEFFRYP